MTGEVHFGGGQDKKFIKSKHHLNLKGKALDKMKKARGDYNEHNKYLEEKEYRRSH